MAVSAEQIDRWRALPSETEVLEFKEAKNQYSTDKLFEYCVAIGNEGGGHLVMGIENHPPRKVIGTAAVDNPGGMCEKIFAKLGFRVDIDAVNHPDGRVVVFGIPACPPGSPFHVDGKYLMRVGEQLLPMSPDRLKRMFSTTTPDWLEEPTKTDLDAVQVLAMLDADLFLKRTNAPAATTLQGYIDVLLKEKFIDETSPRKYSIRRIAALLLAKDLQSFPEIQRKAPRVTVYRGATKLTDPIDHVIGAMGYAVGFRGLVGFVTKKMPHREVIKDGLRTTVAIIPDIIVRELLANALVHQDLSISGTSVAIEMFDNRIEITNPGEPIVPLDRLLDSARSRNERLADAMRRTGICEERGSGIDKVVDAAESMLLPAPSFRATQNKTKQSLPFTGRDRSRRWTGRIGSVLAFSTAP